MQTIEHELRTFIGDNFLYGQSAADLSSDASFLEQGLIDSTGVLELVTFIEKTFAIRVEDEELLPENLDSLDSLKRFVSQKMGRD